MPVTARLFKDATAALRAVEHLEALSLPSVQPSIMAGGPLRDYRDMRKARDPDTGEEVQIPEPAAATGALSLPDLRQHFQAEEWPS